MMITVDLNLIPIFKPILQIQKGTCIMIGGRASGKSRSVSKWVLQHLLTRKDAKVLLVRNQKNKIANSILGEIKSVINDFNLLSTGYFNQRFSVQENTIKNIAQSRDAVFSVGIQTTDSQQTANLKSLTGVTAVIVEESEDVRREEDISRLMDTVIRFSPTVFFLLNTPDKTHWIVQKYFNLENSEYPNHYNLVPKETEDHYCIFSTYKDNPHTIDETRTRYEGYINPKAPHYNPDWYYNQILGLVPEKNTITAIAKRTHKSSWRDDTDKPYTLNHPWIKQQISDEGYYFLAFDGGANTTHSAAVLGYHVDRYDRDIIIQEFYNKQKIDDLKYISEEILIYCNKNNLDYREMKAYGDPAIEHNGDHLIVTKVLGIHINMLEFMKNSTNTKLREAYNNRKKRRLGGLQRFVEAIRADNKPAFIILKNDVPQMYDGIFNGQFRYQLDKTKDNISDDLEQIPPITDICDAYSYYSLAIRPNQLDHQDTIKKTSYLYR